MKLFDFFRNKSRKSDEANKQPINRSGVMIVDDSRFSRSVLRDILENEGFEVVGEASDGQEAIDKAKELYPEIMFLDVEMPVLNGLEALPKIIKNDPGINVIMCTALGQKKIIMKATKAGAKDYVIKPYRKENIIDVLAGYESAKAKSKAKPEEIEESQESSIHTSVDTEEESPSPHKEIELSTNYEDKQYKKYDVVGDVEVSDNEEEVDDLATWYTYTEEVEESQDSDSLSETDEQEESSKIDQEEASKSDQEEEVIEEDLTIVEDFSFIWSDRFASQDFNFFNKTARKMERVHLLDYDSSNTMRDSLEQIPSDKLMFIGMMRAYTLGDKSIDQLNSESASIELSVVNNDNRSLLDDIIKGDIQTKEISMSDYISNFNVSDMNLDLQDKDKESVTRQLVNNKYNRSFYTQDNYTTNHSQ